MSSLALGDIVYLDLNSVDLFGWERKKSDLVIDSIVRGIEAGDEFPAVPVMVISEGKAAVNEGETTINEGKYLLDKFPARSVIVKGKYQLDSIILKYHPSISGPWDGGHRRALGHYIANKPLKCRITCIGAEQTEWINIRELVLMDDREFARWCFGSSYQQLKERDRRYR